MTPYLSRLDEGAQRGVSLNEIVQMRGHIMFDAELTKSIPSYHQIILSSNTPSYLELCTLSK